MSSSSSESKTASIKARLKYETEQAFIEKYSSNISKTGLFVKTTNPRPVGTRVKFEFQIADGTPVLRGLGEVEWDRKEAAQGEPPGMEIKFLKIDAKTRNIVEQVVDFNERNTLQEGRQSILPDKSDPQFEALMSSLESEPPLAPTSSKAHDIFYTGPAETPPWESEAKKALPSQSRAGSRLRTVDKTELSSETRARRAAARQRRLEGKGAQAKDLDLKSVDSLLKELDNAPRPPGKRTATRRHSKAPQMAARDTTAKQAGLNVEQLDSSTTIDSEEIEELDETLHDTGNDYEPITEEEVIEEEALEPDSSDIDLNTDREISLDSELDEILDDTGERQASPMEVSDDMEAGSEEVRESVSSWAPPGNDPLLANGEVDDVINNMLNEAAMGATSPSEISRDQLPETLPDEAVPQGLVRNAASLQSKENAAPETPQSHLFESLAPMPKTGKTTSEQPKKKPGFFRKLFSKAPPTDY